MKINDMPDGPLKHTLLNAAQAVLAESADMHHMLQKADQFLNHEFLEAELKASKLVNEAMKRYNGLVTIEAYVEPGGYISKSKIEHSYPPGVILSAETKARLEVEVIKILSDLMKGKLYNHPTTERAFLEYTEEYLKP